MQLLCPESGLRTTPNWPKIRKMTMTSQLSDMKSTSDFFDVVLFLLSSLFTGPSLMSTSLVLELWQFSFIRDWLEIRKYPHLSFAQYLETGASYRYQIWQMSLINCDWMLQNSRVTAFTAFELLRENQLGGITPLPPRLGLILTQMFQKELVCMQLGWLNFSKIEKTLT